MKRTTFMLLLALLLAAPTATASASPSQTNYVMPVIAIAPRGALLEKLKSNLQEVRARGGELFVMPSSSGSASTTAASAATGRSATSSA